MEIQGANSKLFEELQSSDELNRDLLDQDLTAPENIQGGSAASEEIEDIVANQRQQTAQQFGVAALQESLDSDPVAQYVSILV